MDTTPAPDAPLDLIAIGEITAPHGVRGHLRVTMLTDFPERWRSLRWVYLTPPEGERRPRVPGAPLPVQGGPQRVQVQTARVLTGARTRRRGRIADPEDEHTGPWGGQIHQVLLKLVGINNPETGETLRGYQVQVPRAEAWPLPPDTYYTYQIVNLRVITPDDTLVGTVVDVLTTGSNDVYVLRTPTGKELLVPAIKEIVQEIDPAGGFIRIKDPAEWLAADEPPPRKLRRPSPGPAAPASAVEPPSDESSATS